MEFIRDYADWFYLVGAVLFILTLRGLSGPKTAIQGNRYGMIAMAIAVITTFFVANHPVVWMIVGAMIQTVGLPVIGVDANVAFQSINIVSILGAIAVFLASINIFGGFAVTARMLEMFKPKQKKKEGS